MRVSYRSAALFGLAATFAASLAFAADKAVTVSSPGAVLSVTVETVDGRLFYSLRREGRPVIVRSRLGLDFQEAPDFSEGFVIADVSRDSVDAVWTQPWGEEARVRDRHSALRVGMESAEGPQRRMTLAFRVFDDGVGFRYELPEQPALQGEAALADELTEFSFYDNLKAWWIPAFRDNRYEYQYAASALDSLDIVHTPVTLEGAGIAVSVHEAALTDYASMALERPAAHGQTLKAHLAGWADGPKALVTAPLTTPWRTIQVAEKPHELANSRLILNLNEPNKLGDVSWVKPGRYMGIWWCMHIRTCTWETGPNHGATTENAVRYLDFAAEHGFSGVLIEGWNVGWDGNWYENGALFRFTEPTPDFDIDEVAAHSRKVGVPLIGHHETSANVVNYEAQLDDAFAFAAKHGMRAVKTGYVGARLDDKEWHHGQYMVRHNRKVIETAASHKVSINVHEPIKATGIRRTFPNMMTREGARGGEYDAWSHPAQGNLPEHATVLPFTRMLAGPMDYTAGIVDLRFGENEENGISSTLAKQLALMVVIYSPLQMAADLPENYERHPIPFQFMKQVPADWEESIALDGAIGDYFVVARKDRTGPDWYLGAVTDEAARTLVVPLGFLPPGLRFRAEVYADGEDAHWLHNPQPLTVETRAVTADDTLTLVLAPGGGAAVRVVPEADAR